MKEVQLASMFGGTIVTTVAIGMWLFQNSPIYVEDKMLLGVLGTLYGIFIIVGNGYFLLKNKKKISSETCLDVGRE